MSTQDMWMVRAAKGRVVNEFLDKGVVAIGFDDVGDLGRYTDKAELHAAVVKCRPGARAGNRVSAASQLYRFRAELREGDRVITYDPGRRIYLLGTIKGPYRYDPELIPPFFHVREVDWEGEVERDRLSMATKNTLGSTLTLFRVSATASEELEGLLRGQAEVSAAALEAEEEEDEASLLQRYREEAFEIIKDRVNRLDWDSMQQLVAALLRAMGYKTRVAEPGPDRGVDIMASPDGFGFESPRIMVEVKHRSHAVGSQQIRSFLGGRHKDDKGLYVSTGGFTKDAQYEADRASIPVTLMDLDSLVAGILQYYEQMDMEGRNLLPLTKVYWPA
ncbi:MAG: restriction endonuclease [Gammaproteobacteria bacterium]|nr:restriction endonuclease [Gammaproteobacteria bacterium]